jgi:methylamine dehydrogenase accessory protein MauD
MTVLLFWVAAPALILISLVLFEVIRQNGRILARLEAIEAELAHLSGATPGAARTPPRGLPVGTEAPAFELPSLDGSALRLGDLRGKNALLIFFDPACGFCKKMAPQLAELDGGKSQDPVPVLISAGAPEDTRKLLAEHKVDVKVGFQQKREIAELYKTTGTPTGYLVDEQGRIASELAVGAQALLQLGSSQPAHKGNKPLSESRITRTGLPAGTPAPPFDLPRLDGGRLALSEYNGQRVLLVFSDPHCGPCMKLAPQLEEHYRQHSDPQIVMVSRGDESENRQKAADLNLTFPIVLQRQWEISRQYGMFSTPIGFLIDEHGVISRKVAVGADEIRTVLSETAAMTPTRSG